jgi:hypothetical protein
MSDALPPGAQSLEAPENEGATIVNPPVSQAAAEPEAPVVDPPVTDDEPEGTVVSQGGVKFVPLAAVQSERGKRKDAETKAAQLAEKAQKYDETEAQVRAVMPIIERVKGRPDILAMLDKPPAPVVEAKGPLSDQEAIEYAKDFDLYKTDGTPDTDRAQRIASRHAAMNARQVQQQIAPMVQTEAQRQSHGLFNHYANQKDANGNVVDQKILASFWQNVPPEMSAQPGVAQVLYLAALGQQVASGKQPAPKPAPVVHTESSGGRMTTPAALTSLDESIMKHAGIEKKAYETTAARYQPGRINSLEG